MFDILDLVVHQNYIRLLERRIRSAGAHANSNVRGRETGGVIDTVANHRNSCCSRTAFLADRKGACTFCLQTQEWLEKPQSQQPCNVRCPFGLTETRIPVQLGDRLIGFLQVGQVFTQSPKLTAFTKAIRRVFPTGSAAEKKVTDLWKKTPVIPAEKYAATVQLLKFFAKQLSGISNQIAIEETNAESPVITRARQYISEHKTEVLSLPMVAKVAGASVFHFCKMFRKSTGLNFTDYVARARMEDAKKGCSIQTAASAKLPTMLVSNRSPNSTGPSKGSLDKVRATIATNFQAGPRWPLERTQPQINAADINMINPNQAGFVVGALIGGWHVIWATLVVAGWAQPLINFIFWAHMIKPVYVIGPFDVVAAGTLLVITFCSGYVFGFIGGSLWNKIHRESAAAS